jgi:quinol monooxygenase YgiN
MLIRLVRMWFEPDNVDEFLRLYHAAHPTISSQPGCFGVRLVRQIDDPASFATWSRWESAAALDAYRTGPFFRAFWPQVRALFRVPAEAVSFEEVGITEALND